MLIQYESLKRASVPVYEFKFPPLALLLASPRLR